MLPIQDTAPHIVVEEQVEALVGEVQKMRSWAADIFSFSTVFRFSSSLPTLIQAFGIIFYSPCPGMSNLEITARVPDHATRPGST